MIVDVFLVKRLLVLSTLPSTVVKHQLELLRQLKSKVSLCMRQTWGEEEQKQSDLVPDSYGPFFN